MTISLDDSTLKGVRRQLREVFGGSFRRQESAWRILIAIAAAMVSGMAAEAGSNTTQFLWNDVEGATPTELIASLRSHPLPASDGGAAFASITDRYEINLDTRDNRGACVMDKVGVDFRFVITLPRADEAGMSPATRQLWRDFVAFSRRHEEGHRNIYLECGRRFEAEAAKMRSAIGCTGLRDAAIALFHRHYDACLLRHQAYDRRESGRLRARPLMRAAR